MDYALVAFVAGGVASIVFVFFCLKKLLVVMLNWYQAPKELLDVFDFGDKIDVISPSFIFNKEICIVVALSGGRLRIIKTGNVPAKLWRGLNPGVYKIRKRPADDNRSFWGDCRCSLEQADEALPPGAMTFADLQTIREDEECAHLEARKSQK